MGTVQETSNGGRTIEHTKGDVFNNQHKRADIFLDFLSESGFPCLLYGQPYPVLDGEDRIL